MLPIQGDRASEGGKTTIPANQPGRQAQIIIKLSLITED